MKLISINREWGIVAISIKNQKWIITFSNGSKLIRSKFDPNQNTLESNAPCQSLDFDILSKVFSLIPKTNFN